MAKTQSRTDTPAGAHAEESQARMSFGEHLEELRKRVFRAMFGSVFGVGLCLYYVNNIVLWIMHPFEVVMQRHRLPHMMLSNKPGEVVMGYLGIGVQAGLILSSPWIVYQLWAFIGAGLYKRERKIVYRYVGPSALLFLLGVAFFYFIVLPLTLNFFVSFTEGTAGGPVTPTAFEKFFINDTGPGGVPTTFPAGDSIDQTQLFHVPLVSSDPPKPKDATGILVFNEDQGQLKLITKDHTLVLMVTQEGSLFANFPRLDDYLSFVMFTALVFGLAFEMPMVIVILAQVGIVEVQTFRAIRKYAYFALAVVSGLAAPSTDLMTMLCLLLPMVALYELGIVVASIVVRKRTEDTA